MMTVAQKKPTETDSSSPAATAPITRPNERWIEVDLSDLHLSSDMSSLDHRAEVAANIYERFVPYADEGWEWVIHPASRRFDSWVTGEGAAQSEIVAARLLCRRAGGETPDRERPAHGLSSYRTRQLTRRLWSAEPASKNYRPIT